MKILILGATGNLGRHITQQALTAGHDVTAFARNPKSLTIEHPALSHISGDANDADDVLNAVEGHDAVVIALGTSDLDWTIVRPSAFSNEPGNGELHIGFPPSQTGLDFTVAKSEEIPERSYVHRAVSISR